MLTAVAIIPSAPVMVPELAGEAAAELVDLRDAVAAAVAALPNRWVAVGVGDEQGRYGAGAAGTFAGYGVDVPVAMSPGAGQPGDLPLCALIAAWVRGAYRPDAVIETCCYADTLDNTSAVAAGRALRSQLDAIPDDVGLLVVADGCHTLTPPAPGGYRPESVDVQAVLDAALAAGDVRALSALDDAVVGRAAFSVLGGAVAGVPAAARELYRGAPYGVGYFVGVWQP